MQNTRKSDVTINSGAMADIAFLLLTFFLVTTQINNHQGLPILLPEFTLEPISTELNERNVFTIQINAANQFLIEEQQSTNVSGLRDELKEFILNSKHSGKLSESPQKAVISIKADRGCSHAVFIQVVDEAQAAYYEIYSERAGITPKAFRALDTNDPIQKLIYDKARLGVPMNISIAEPSKM